MSGERAYLCLADGTTFEGVAWGAPGIATGEVVFTTGMTGYQEVLTDPSYCGQIVTMTAPQIGNTGINREDDESTSGAPHVAGFIVRDLSPVAANFRANETLDAYLARHGVVALAGIDTRLLTRTIRDRGAQNGAIGKASPEELVRRAREAPSMEGLDLVQRVTPKAPYAWTEGSGAFGTKVPGVHTTNKHVVCIDLGIKRNILRSLVDVGCRVTVVPAQTSAADILDLAPDGVFVSNGPGDPAAVSYAIDTVRGLVGKKPLFGICLGHQILALAMGGRTYKLKFGHRGINQPVKDLDTGRIEITTQNHGFAVDLASLEGKARTTHVHLNDGTSEGLDLPGLSAFSVQYHPEAAAGPHDALYLFQRFADRMEEAARSA
ncbi:glutamine-hydrolyzing carbamoyl-phosphate synthase small subunit [Polyangium spumosum]|uniref:Carbamoyl phosphate synthase small chain n=1 Tax=Polyangium spumosum TaxID=889282 RepID=A0A6N7PLS4_9BACT|nr:glutamine-hydrolyzing carbamoyl-phosphate synthase small subunit [Polyangium spumosum]MRG91786.1 glutamine-hydrolyzing carbamoyl-phosphate synthase small subunit [Polyangium spumosum]